MPKNMRHVQVPLGYSMIVLSSVFYGLYNVFYHLIGDSFGAFIQVAIRSCLVVVTLLVIMRIVGERWQPIQWRRDAKWLLGFMLASSIIGGPAFYAVNTIGVGATTILSYGGYIVSMFGLGKLISHDRLTKEMGAAITLALVGVILVFRPGGDEHLAALGSLAALVSGVGIGLDMAVSKHIKYPTSQTTIITWASGIAPNIIVGLLLHERVAAFSIHTDQKPWVYMLLFTIVAIASSWTAVHGVKLIESGIAGILGLLEIIWAVLFGIILFNERPALLAYAGMLCIVSAAVIPYLQAMKSSDMVEELPA